MANDLLPLVISERIKSILIFAIGLLVLFAGPEVSKDLVVIGVPESYIPVIQALSRIGAAVLLWLGLSPLTKPIGREGEKP